MTPEEGEESTIDFASMDEKCLVRLHNYKDAVNPENSIDAAPMNASTLSKDKHESRTSAVNAADADA